MKQTRTQHMPIGMVLIFLGIAVTEFLAGRGDDRIMIIAILGILLIIAGAALLGASIRRNGT